MDAGRPGTGGERSVLDEHGRPIQHATPTSPPPPPPPAIRSDIVAIIVTVLAAVYFWKVPPVSLTGSVLTAGITVCAFMFLVMDIAPSLRRISIRLRTGLTGLFGAAFAAAALMLLAHGDIGEPRPAFSGLINSVASFPANYNPKTKQASGPPFSYWLSIELENNGGPSYTNGWLPFFVNREGTRVYGNVIPAPPKGSPRNLPVRTRAGPLLAPWTNENVIDHETFPNPVDRYAAAKGVLVVQFFGDEQPPVQTSIQLRFIDRLGKEYVLKYTEIGPSL